MEIVERLCQQSKISEIKFLLLFLIIANLCIVTQLPSEDRKYSYLACLLVHQRDMSTKTCAATFLTPKSILTAASCLSKAVNVEINLCQNPSKDFHFSMTLDSTDFFLHLDYNETNFNNNIAIIDIPQNHVSNDRSNFVGLSDDTEIFNQNLPESDLIALGWSEGVEMGHYLSVHKVVGFSHKLCRRLYKLNIPESQFCVLGVEGPFKGDSGGPIFSNEYQMGIISYGIQDGSRMVGITNVEYYSRWIQNHVDISTFFTIDHTRQSCNAKFSCQVYMHVVERETQTKNCAGTFISSQFILTAAHCLAKAVNVTVSIYSAPLTTNITDPSVTIEVYPKDFIIHENYTDNSDSNLENDIAMIKLKEAFPLVNYTIDVVKLYGHGLEKLKDDLPGLKMTALIWRSVNKISTPPLLEQTVFGYSEKLCNFLYNLNLTELQFCVLDIDDLYERNIGGPVLLNDDQIGIISHRFEKAVVITKVNPYQHWIETKNIRLWEIFTTVFFLIFYSSILIIIIIIVLRFINK